MNLDGYRIFYLIRAVFHNCCNLQFMDIDNLAMNYLNTCKNMKNHIISIKEQKKSYCMERNIVVGLKPLYTRFPFSTRFINCEILAANIIHFAYKSYEKFKNDEIYYKLYDLYIYFDENKETQSIYTGKCLIKILEILFYLEENFESINEENIEIFIQKALTYKMNSVTILPQLNKMK